MTASTSALAATGSEPYVGFRKHTEAADYAGATRRGAAVEASGDVRLAVEGLATGADKKLYGVKPYYYGVLESAPLDAARPFDTAIASWNAHTPPDTWIQVELRAYRPGDGHWTKYYNMGYWASATTKVERSSVARQGDTDGFVATDTLLLYGDPVYTRYQYRLTLFTLSPSVTPRVSLLSVMTSDSSREPAGLAVESDQEAWGRDLGVPQRSQMIYPKGGEVWCSPTSTSMVLAYWGRDVPVPEAAAATYDHEYEGNGNWPFNTAWAATYGLEAYVTRLGSFAQLEEWVSAGVPVVISYAFGPGELPGTPIPDSDGHIMVVRGFEADGDVIVNDPAAASDAEARRVYDREILERLWLRASGGTVYLIYPEGHSVPTSKAFGSW
jgi:hypothetical protein